jgi:hypothetical protein
MKVNVKSDPRGKEETATPEICSTIHHGNKQRLRYSVIGHRSNGAKEIGSHVYDMSQLGEVMRRDATDWCIWFSNIQVNLRDAPRNHRLKL